MLLYSCQWFFHSPPTRRSQVSVRPPPRRRGILQLQPTIQSLSSDFGVLGPDFEARSEQRFVASPIPDPRRAERIELLQAERNSHFFGRLLQRRTERRTR